MAHDHIQETVDILRVAQEKAHAVGAFYREQFRKLPDQDSEFADCTLELARVYERASADFGYTAADLLEKKRKRETGGTK